MIKIQARHDFNCNYQRIASNWGFDSHGKIEVSEGKNRYRQRLIAITTPLLSVMCYQSILRVYAWVSFVYILYCVLDNSTHSAHDRHLSKRSTRSNWLETRFSSSKSSPHDSAVRRSIVLLCSEHFGLRSRENATKWESLENNEATTSAGGRWKCKWLSRSLQHDKRFTASKLPLEGDI